jgi:hypothetical protein
MTRQQESAIIDYLCRPYAFTWNESTTLRDISRDLSAGVPTVIDRRSLEDLGLSSDLKIAGEIDDFAHGDHEASSRHWWIRHGNHSIFSGGGKPDPPSVAAKLLHLLRANDLSLQIRWGQLVIVSIDAVAPQIRVYDVTTLIESGDPKTSNGWSRRSPPDGHRNIGASLTNVIQCQIDPETWEALGGTSTMSLISSTGKHRLLVSTPTLVHWKIQTLLDRLNHQPTVRWFSVPAVAGN